MPFHAYFPVLSGCTFEEESSIFRVVSRDQDIRLCGHEQLFREYRNIQDVGSELGEMTDADISGFAV